MNKSLYYRHLNQLTASSLLQVTTNQHNKRKKGLFIVKCMQKRDDNEFLSKHFNNDSFVIFFGEIGRGTVQGKKGGFFSRHVYS